MAKSPVLRHPYNIEDYDGTEFPEKSLTKISQQAETDIQRIWERFEKTGVVEQNDREALFIDVTKFGSYQEVQEHLAIVREMFDQQPAHVRRVFDNDAAKYIDALCDESRVAELQELGVLSKDPEKAVEKPPEKPVVEPPKAA